MASAGMNRHLAMAATSETSTPTPRLEIRRAARADRASIESLEWEEKWIQDIYGFTKLEPLLEHAALSLVAVDELGAVQGFAVFDGQPLEALVHGHAWRSWLRHTSPLLGTQPLSPATGLFQTRLVCPRAAVQHVETSFLTWLFASLPDLERVFHAARCAPSELAGLEAIGFRLISQLNGRDSVHEVHRRCLVPRLATRPARLEDHDDLRPMFDADEEGLREAFGEYFLAEVIADERESSYSAVVEVEKLAVGLMSVTTEVDIDALNASFELAPFHGLRKPDPDDVTGIWSRLSQEVMGVRPSTLHTVYEAPAAQKAASQEGAGDSSQANPAAVEGGEGAEAAAVQPDAAGKDSAPADAGEEAEAAANAGKPDAAGKDAATADGGKEAEAVANAGQPDAAGKDATTADGGKEAEAVANAGQPDAAGKDATTADGGKEAEAVANAGQPDATGKDATTADGGKEAEAVANAGQPDAAGKDATTADGGKEAEAVANAGQPDTTGKDADVASVTETKAIKSTASKIEPPPGEPGNADPAAADNSSDGDNTADDDETPVADAAAEPAERQIPLLELLWGPAVLEPGFGEPEVEEAPIPDDEVPDNTRPVLEMIWGFPVSADGRITRKVSFTQPGVGAEPATGPEPEPRAVPQYRGAPNAAAISLFCIRDEYACRSLDLLPAVLERMRDVEYLVMTVPADAPETPLLELFTRVPHRAASTFPGQLYVFHRASLVTDFSVGSGKSGELGAIRTLVKHTEAAESVLLSVRELFMSGVAQNSVMVVRCQDHVVGVIVLMPELEVEYLRAHFEIEEYVTCEHHDNGFGHLHHMVLNPIFRRFARVILGEVMRLTKLSVLLYPLLPPDSEDASGHSLVSSLEVLWPVTWRRQIQYPLAHGSLGTNIPKPHILQRREPLALQLTSLSNVLLRRERVNSRVVVVGGGDAGLAVLERLAFSRQLLFTNVTLVEPHGFPDDSGAGLAAGMRSTTESFQQERLGTMWLHAWVNLVRGVMHSIDRKQKLIVVSDVGEIPYDHLLLTCGLQYQLPTRLVPRPSRPFTDRRPLHAPSQLPEAPDNVFRVNSQYDAERALDYVKEYCLERSENVIVYGRFLETLTCLETLTKLPVPLHRLILVLPPGDEHGNRTQLTHDPQIDNGVFHQLRAAENGIRILEGYTLACWDVKYNNRIYRVQLRGGEDGKAERHLSCCGLFVYDHRGVELVTYKALNDASLVFDGRLVVDHQFATNDADIRAVGTMTKYSRRYYADSFDHFEYSSREVGHALGDQLLRSYGAITDEDKKLSTKDRRRSSLAGVPLPPEFHWPLVTRARLPGGWTYLHVTTPKPLTDQEPPWVLTTGDPVYPSATGYMRIEVSVYRVVQKITCFSKNEIETDNIIALYGLHEVLLNNMVARYEEGLIPELYVYFREPWAMVVFHDRFAVLRADIRRAVLRCHCRDGKLTLEEKIVDNLCRYSELSEQELIKILEDFRAGGVDKMVERWILQYLANNQYHLPMYARVGTADSLKINRDTVIESVNNAISTSRFAQR